MTTSTLPAPAPIAATGCCPPFDPSAYDGRELVWRDEPFVKVHVRSVMHVPIGIAGKITRAQEQIAAAGATCPAPLMLSEERSPWGSDLYIHVTRPVPGAQMTKLSGTFMTRVYDGPWREMGKWAEDTTRWVRGQGRAVSQLFFAYTMCPACAKAYGHNYVVSFAKVDGVSAERPSEVTRPIVIC